MVIPDDQSDQLPSGIIMVNPEEKDILFGTVHLVGPDVDDVEEQERIMFGKYAGTQITLEDVPMILMRESDIIAVVEDE